MGKLISLLYGIISYGVFFCSFLYAIGFMGNMFVPKSIDTGSETGMVQALTINLTLLGLFAIQHTIMARLKFKQWWTKIIPKQVERSTFVLFASLLLLLLFWQWRPMMAVVWKIDHYAVASIIQMFFWLGWTIVLASTFMINHFDLFGLRQVYLHFRDQKYTACGFKTSFLYNYIRHPIMLGFIIAFWATPVMTLGHLVFSVGTTVYILIGIHFEEKTLVRILGSRYKTYKHCVPMLIPFTKIRTIRNDRSCRP